MTTSILQGVTYRAICRTNGGTWGIRTRATVGPSLETYTSRASATPSAAVSSPFGSVIASILPDWRKLARAIERTRTPIALARAIFVRGQRTICNLRGGFKALRSLSFLPLIPLRQEPTSGLFKALFLAPVLSSAAAVHGQTMQQKDGQDHGKSTRKYG